ncbi:DUF5688 family protein [Ruminococcus sp. CLA-AA-H200]|uniref:DUF5688 family protein n=1 Tax=Ruminococcus turbiniformis TaxID=2881258 RepID=A0ABS8FVI9_9FIRM|nr:DUF5688 family protein [Ruminococcus turbiniformis]MCC2253569.1 DUF5688 family protein [Ruminococcus turbiniformis]
MFEETFMTTLAEKVREELGGNYVVESRVVQKEHATMHGFSIGEKESCIQKIIYLEQACDIMGSLDEKWELGDIDHESVYQEMLAKILVKNYQQAGKSPCLFGIENLISWDELKQYVVLRLTSDREYAKQYLHWKVSDLYAIAYAEKTDCDYSESIGITRKLADRFHVTEEDVFSIACENTEKNTILVSMTGALDSCFCKEPFKDSDNLFGSNCLCDPDEMMYVLTNKNKLFGAAGILLPSIQKRLKDFLKEDFFILPSSVHELILVKAKNCMKVSELEEMVKTVNKTEVIPEDRLSDSVYKIENSSLCVAKD